MGLSCVIGPVWPVGPGCYSQAALPLPLSKPLYYPSYCNTVTSVISVDQGACRQIIREYVLCQRSRHSSYHAMIVRLVVKLAAIIVSYAVPCQCHISEYFVPTSKAARVRHQARKRASKGDQCVSACVAPGAGVTLIQLLHRHISPLPKLCNFVLLPQASKC